MWWKSAVFYELYVDKFAGNFSGLTEKLSYLQNLGINAILLLPHFPSQMKDEGYDVSDYKNVRAELGTLEDFDNFIIEAHNKGIKVIIDLVLNHTSIDHLWFQDAKKSKESHYRDYYIWSETGEEFKKALNPFSYIKENNWIKNKETGDFYFSTFYPEQADLNWDNPQILLEFTSIIDFWLKRGVDGFRLDAITHLIKREGSECVSDPQIHVILKNLRSFLNAKKKDAIFLAEVSSPIKDAVNYFGKGDECQLIFNFYLTAKIWLAMKRQDKEMLKDVCKNIPDIPKDCKWAVFLRNHDELNLQTLSMEEKAELIGWFEKHGHYRYEKNGVAVRIGEVFKDDPWNIIYIHKLLFEMKGVPFIYCGDEIGMKNAIFKESPADYREYVRNKMDWEEAERQLKDKNSLFYKFKSLIANREK